MHHGHDREKMAHMERIPGGVKACVKRHRFFKQFYYLFLICHILDEASLFQCKIYVAHNILLCLFYV